MIKIYIAILTFLSMIYSDPHHKSNSTKLYHQNFGKWKFMKGFSSSIFKPKSYHRHPCKLKKKIIYRSNYRGKRKNLWIHQLYSLNEMRMNRLITKREYERAKGFTLKKLRHRSTQKPHQVGNELKLLTFIHNSNGLNDNEFNRLKKNIMY
ncbi:MAG: hypothetical protein CMG69_06215 [Candidatus Marinimicrobia bacterium]|nr:hypothetical protein [Candidatus Neomarinimicrobiota bacterium]|tara:strand:- start:2650 stop:3102 length:453 start_codon:yes stop_codon:yes gene_type:complete